MHPTYAVTAAEPTVAALRLIRHAQVASLGKKTEPPVVAGQCTDAGDVPQNRQLFASLCGAGRKRASSCLKGSTVPIGARAFQMADCDVQFRFRLRRHVTP